MRPGPASWQAERMPRLTRYLLFAALFLALLLTAWDLGRGWARAYERMLVARVSNALSTLELDWARVHGDGLRIRLHGHAPDRFAQELALSSARATAPVARVTDYTTVSLAPPIVRDPIRVELHRDAERVTLTGQVSGPDMQATFARWLSDAAPDLAQRDLTGIQARRPPAGWGPEIEIAAAAAAELPNASILITPGAVRIDGQAATTEARAELEARLSELSAGEVGLDLRVRVPLSVIAPFVFSVERELGGSLRLDDCAARTQTERARLADLLSARGLAISDATCPIGLGGPLDDWTGAIDAGLMALDRLPAGRFELEYRTATLTAHPPTSPRTFEGIAALFAKELPPGFAAVTGVPGLDVLAEIEIARLNYWLSLETGPDGATITGRMPNAEAATAVETYAAALFGSDQVRARLATVDAPPPAAWQSTTLAFLELLHRTGGGRADLAGRRAVMEAEAPSPEAAGTLHRAALAAAGPFELETRLHIDLASAHARLPLPPSRCLSELNALVREDPVEFEIGSARLAEASDDVLDALAGMIDRCAALEIEIAGHTDADGGTDYNQRLSRARADAVKMALIRRGAPGPVLTAKGYGETEPIASNATREGRALNRRIEFRVGG